MIRPFCLSLAVILTLAMAPLAVAQDAKLVDNPEYTNWAQFKPGSSVTYKQVVDGAAKLESTVLVRLLEVKADKCVLEMETAVKVMGNEIKQAAIKRDVPKQVDAAVAAQQTNPEGKVSDGTEKVTVSGQSYEAKWYKTETKTGENNTTATVFVTDKIPGRLVRLQSKTDGPGGNTMSMDAIEVVIK